jgi:hypothetical protein
MGEKDLEKLFMGFFVAVIVMGLLTILFKVIGFLLKRLFTFFRL